jgi:3-dehydroquinate dehydratase-1
MRMTRALTVRGQSIGGGKEPLICAPLVGRDETAVLAELAVVVAKAPDLLEWRVDFFSDIGNAARVAALAGRVRAQSNGTPMIFTRRSTREGGETIGISEQQVLELYRTVCRSGNVDFIDWELSSDPAQFAQVVALARETGVQLIGSFHDFEKTPTAQDIVAKLIAMEAAGSDIAKVAVMPQGPQDVLTLLEATLEGQRRIGLPIISMSMGAFGALSRLFGWVFGSSVTFAVGKQPSAPGQVPIEDLRFVLDVMQRSLNAGK